MLFLFIILFISCISDLKEMRSFVSRYILDKIQCSTWFRVNKSLESNIDFALRHVSGDFWNSFLAKYINALSVNPLLICIGSVCKEMYVSIFFSASFNFPSRTLIYDRL